MRTVTVLSQYLCYNPDALTLWHQLSLAIMLSTSLILNLNLLFDHEYGNIVVHF